MTAALAALTLIVSNSIVAQELKIKAAETRTFAPTTHLKKIGSITFSSYGDPIYTEHGVLTLYDLNDIEGNAKITDSVKKTLLQLKKQNPDAQRALLGTGVQTVGTVKGMTVFYDTTSGKPVFDLSRDIYYTN